MMCIMFVFCHIKLNDGFPSLRPVLLFFLIEKRPLKIPIHGLHTKLLRKNWNNAVSKSSLKQCAFKRQNPQDEMKDDN